ncbi:MAG TPA: hypothetical protein VFP86_06530 [bacterium]|nr:hypothetical protein [bacterium]
MIAVSLAAMALFAVAIAPAAGALSMKACQLITAKDVQSVLGDGYTAQNMMENEIMSQCAYTKGKEAVKEAAVSISLQQTIYDSVQYLKTAQEGIKQNGGPAVTPVGGLGEGAFYVVDPKQKPPILLLQFGKGKLEVVLSVLRGGKPDIEAAQKLAKIAYSRLK